MPDDPEIAALLDAPTGNSDPEINQLLGPEKQSIQQTSFVGQMFASPQGPGQGNELALPNFKKDILTNEPVGFGGNIVRSIPSLALGAISGGNPAGFMAGEALREAAVSGNAVAGNTQAPSTLQAVGSPLLSYGTAYASNLLSPYIGRALIGGTLAPAEASEMTAIPFSTAQLPGQQTLQSLPNGQIGGALGYLGRGVKNALQYIQRNYAGVKSASAEIADKFPDLVNKYIGVEPEIGDDLANELRTNVSNASQKLEDAYKAGVLNLQNSKMPIKINLQNNLGAVFNNIAKEAGYMDPARNASSPEAAFYMKNILSRVNDMQAASPLDIYYLQKDLNRYITDNINTSLGGDLLATKDALRLFIEDHPQLSSIADMNSAWSNMKLIEGLAKKVTNQDDLVRSIQRVFNNPADTIKKRGLDQLGQLVPEVANNIKNIQAYGAAKDFTPFARTAPPTGLGASMLNTDTALPVAAGYFLKSGNPLAAGATLAVAGLKKALTSPRLSLQAMQASKAFGSLLSNSIGNLVFPSATVAGQAATRGILTNYQANPAGEGPTTPYAMERFIRNNSNPFKQNAQ